MGFLDGLFGGVIGYAASEIKNESEKKKQDTEKFNSQFNELQTYQERLNSLLEEVGSMAIYIFDASTIEAGTSIIEKNKINEYINKVNRYISLGGDGKYIFDISSIDDYIEKVKYLSSINALDRQLEFAKSSCFETMQIINEESNDLNSYSDGISADIINKEYNNTDKDEVLERLLESDYQFFNYYENLSLSDPIRGCCGMIEVILQSIQMNLFESRFSPKPILTTDEIKEITPIIEKYLDMVQQNSGKTSKKGRCIYYLTLMVSAEIAFYKGEFARSIDLYIKALKGWTEAQTESFGYVFHVIASVFTLLNIMDLREEVENVYEEFKFIIQEEYKSYTNLLSPDESQNEYTRKMLSIVDKRHDINYFIMLSLFEFTNPYESKMADNCMPYGEIDISYGMSCVDYNKDTNTISLYLQRVPNAEITRGSVIVENARDVIRVQREKAQAILK